MSDIRVLPAVDARVETGAIQFGDDWPGTFIRGKHAFVYATHLETALVALEAGPADLKAAFTLDVLRRLLSDLQGSLVIHGDASVCHT